MKIHSFDVITKSKIRVHFEFSGLVTVYSLKPKYLHLLEKGRSDDPLNFPGYKPDIWVPPDGELRTIGVWGRYLYLEVFVRSSEDRVVVRYHVCTGF